MNDANNDASYARKQEETASKLENAEIALKPLANRYLQQLMAAEFQPDHARKLRIDFIKEAEQLKVEYWRRTNVSYYFESTIDIYISTIATPDNLPLPEPIIIGSPDAVARVDFESAFKNKFTQRQSKTFNQRCDAYLMNQGKRQKK